MLREPKKTGAFLRTNLHGQIAEHLGTRVTSGELRPGEILPTEAILGVSLGVSRTAIREAIKVLSAKGLIEVRRKTGSRVRPQREWNALDPDVISWQFSGEGLPSAIFDLQDLRKIIEPAAARLAAKRATPADILEIGTAYSEMAQATGNTAASVEADLRFHLAILEATHNSFMRPFGSLIQAALRASFRLTNVDLAAYRRSLLRHRKVFTAIRDGSPEEADLAMQAVLRGTQRDVAHSLELHGGEEKKAKLTKK